MGYYWGSELYHKGKSKLDGAPRGSGRYPLGSGDRPYQGRPKLFAKFRKQKAEVRPEQRKTPEEIIKTGSATEVASILRLVSPQDLQYAIDRLNKESIILKLASQEAYANSTEKSLRDLGDKIKMTTDMIKVGTDFYNSFAKMYNATLNGKKKPLTIIGQKDGGNQGQDQSKKQNYNNPQDIKKTNR